MARHAHLPLLGLRRFDGLGLFDVLDEDAAPLGVFVHVPLVVCRACSSSSRADHWRATSACVSEDLLTSLPALRRLPPVLYYGWIDAGSTSNPFLSLVGVARSEPIGF